MHSDIRKWQQMRSSSNRTEPAGEPAAKKRRREDSENYSEPPQSDLDPIPLAFPPTCVLPASQDAENQEDDVSLPSDTLAALQLLCSEFPKLPGVAPFALKSQLYAVINDKTTADRELDALRCVVITTNHYDCLLFLCVLSVLGYVYIPFPCAGLATPYEYSHCHPTRWTVPYNSRAIT
jgi:hypothetical protein